MRSALIFSLRIFVESTEKKREFGMTRDLGLDNAFALSTFLTENKERRGMLHDDRNRQWNR